MKVSTKMISSEKYDNVMKLLSYGHSIAEVSRMTGVNRSSISNWKIRGERVSSPLDLSDPTKCITSMHSELTEEIKKAYSYILGLYLGDGCIYELDRTEKMTITLDKQYEVLNNYTVETLGKFFKKSPYIFDRSLHGRGNAIDVNICTSTLSLLFPQHGKGKKHNRDIILTDWQLDVIDPISIVKGLIMSDGSYYIDRQSGIMKYSFSNKSVQLIGILAKYLSELGISFAIYTKLKKTELVVHKKLEVEKLHEMIGDKNCVC